MALTQNAQANLQVVFEESLAWRKVILNRPAQLNSLNYEMIVQMLKKLKVYEDESTVKFVMLKGNGKAFCAGGDIKAAQIYMTQGHWSFGASFYRKQLCLDYLLATYNKPLVAFVNGIVMGGGAGLSMQATFRIVSEKTVFSMPEASVGVIPDVGASYFLSRLPGSFGEYLGLTGAQLDGTEMLACGLATHYILSKDFVLLENELCAVDFSDQLVKQTISDILNKFVKKCNIKQGSAYARLEIINKCFSKKTVEEILSSLETYETNMPEKWIKEAIKSMKSASPLSLKLFLRSVREGRSQKLEQCLTREYMIFCHIVKRTINEDHFEGIRAMLIDKDRKPQWKPLKLELITEEMVDKCFTNVDKEYCEPLILPARSNQAGDLISRM